MLHDSGDRDILVARITTQASKAEADHKVIRWRESGLLAESWVRLSKQATIEKQFVMKKLGALEASETGLIKTILRKMFAL